MIILDAKTDYSFMRGFGTPEQWLARCKEIGVTAFGVADYCSTWGHAPFKKAFKGSGVKLLYGVQIPVVHKLEKDPRHSLVTLIAKHNLVSLYELASLAEQQTYYRPRLLWDQLNGFDGYIIINYINPAHSRYAARLEGNCRYVGINAIETPELNLPAVYAYAPRYPAPADRQAYELVQQIAGLTKIGEVEQKPLHLLRNSEMISLMGDDSDAIDVMAGIALEATADIAPGTLVKSQSILATKKQKLLVMARQGATELGIDFEITPNYEMRLQRELDVIGEKGFEDYFFFVADLVTWARDRMVVGPGRGSSSGSLLCYLLGITTVDPLKFDTLFERFIDITRPDWPDIDIDFPDTRREEVFIYLKNKYGNDRVARLGTLSEFGGKSAFNDVGRVTSIPIDVTRALGKFTEGAVQGLVISPARLMGLDGKEPLLDSDHMKLVDKYPQIKLAASIDGHVRHHGVHAAGVVVTERPVVEHGTINKDGVLEMDMKGAEDIGLLKMDALGLRTLSVLQEACDLAGIKTSTLFALDWKDPAVYDRIFKADRVTGVFQFEGHSVRALMNGIKTERFDDLCALTSLARPGPLIGGAAEKWVKCRLGAELPRELHPSLEKTYGVIVYQEQAMSVVRDLAGFTEPEVNGFRRAVGKKEIEKLKAYRPKFVDGATLNFYTADGNQGIHLMPQYREKAELLWEELCEFGSYAFNYSHAVAYSMISYMAAWLKHYHPLEFAAACLKHAADDEQGKNLLRELSEEGYKYVPFDPEISDASWSIVDGVLYGGFDSVRGFGDATAKALLRTRANNPAGWLDDITDTQRTRLLAEFNTPWHELTYYGEKFAVLYSNPDAWRSEGIDKGIRGPVYKIRDIPPIKGNYAFIGRIVRKQARDANDPSKVAARGGGKYETNTTFTNLFIEDDTAQMGATINRFKTEDFRWLIDSDTDGRDFFFRGNIINNDGRNWIFIDSIIELKGIPACPQPNNLNQSSTELKSSQKNEAVSTTTSKKSTRKRKAMASM